MPTKEQESQTGGLRHETGGEADDASRKEMPRAKAQFGPYSRYWYGRSISRTTNLDAFIESSKDFSPHFFLELTARMGTMHSVLALAEYTMVLRHGQRRNERSRLRKRRRPRPRNGQIETHIYL